MLYTWNIVGHDAQLRALEYDLDKRNLAHAYLFSGPSRVGKYSAAKMFAKILQCPNNFCRTCPVCMQIDKGSHSDTIILEDDHESSVKIDEVRDIIARLHMSSRSAHKILVIQNVERMTPEAVNSILKTLEEPPRGTVFIFTTTVFKTLLPTLVSRVRTVRFHRIPEDLLISHLREKFSDLSPDELKEIAFFSVGKPGQGAMIASDPDLLHYYRELYAAVRTFLSSSSISDRFSFAQAISEEPQKMHDFLDVLTSSLRHLVLTKRSFRLIDLIERIHETKRLLKRNVNVKLTLENLMLQF